MSIYDDLTRYLDHQITAHDLSKETISIRCQALSVEEAIGKPDRDDYPIVKGREVMVEADFKGSRGQAFTDEFGNADFTLKELLELNLDSNRNRSCFVAGLNAVMRHLGLCDKTVHCRDMEPKTCAGHLKDVIPSGNKVLLIGYQPGFLAALAPLYHTRVIDLDKANIGKNVSGVIIESPDRTQKAIAASDMILATGSCLVNGTIADFLNKDKPVIFFGVTIAGAAKILNLKTYCQCGH
jgi:uncharacterized protein (DUF4213/DUF364 family)